LTLLAAGSGGLRVGKGRQSTTRQLARRLGTDDGRGRRLRPLAIDVLAFLAREAASGCGGASLDTGGPDGDRLRRVGRGCALRERCRGAPAEAALAQLHAIALAAR